MKFWCAMLFFSLLGACGGGAGGDGGPTIGGAASTAGCTGTCASSMATNLTVADVNRVVSQAVLEAQSRGALMTTTNSVCLHAMNNSILTVKAHLKSCQAGLALRRYY